MQRGEESQTSILEYRKRERGDSLPHQKGGEEKRRGLCEHRRKGKSPFFQPRKTVKRRKASIKKKGKEEKSGLIPQSEKKPRAGSKVCYQAEGKSKKERTSFIFDWKLD